MKCKTFVVFIIGLMTVFIIVIYTTNIFQTLLHRETNIDKLSVASSMGLGNVIYSDSINGIYSHSKRGAYTDSKSVPYSESRKIKPVFIPKDPNTAFQLGFKHCNKTFQRIHYITVQDTVGRLGNNVFRLLALLSTAKDHCYTPVFTDKFYSIINPLFDLPSMKKIKVIPKEWKEFKEISNGKYSPGIMTLDHHSNWTLKGYLQTWRYFDKHDAYIRSVLQFKKGVRESVIKYMNSTVSLRDKTTICVHIRRGDFLTQHFTSLGFGVAGVGYFNKSMQYFLNKFKGTPVSFVILSDDTGWCKKNLKNNTGNVYFSPFSSSRSADSAAKDMALMAYCDHSIISGGTFGWIGAWLGNGHVVYFKGYPIPGSEMDRSVNRDEYYPSGWVGMM